MRARSFVSIAIAGLVFAQGATAEEPTTPPSVRLCDLARVAWESTSAEPQAGLAHARCEHDAGRHARAYAIAERVRKDAARLDDAARSDLAALDASLAWSVTTLTLAVSEPGADVSIDGARIGATPLAPVVLDRGVHHLRIEKAGFVPIDRALGMEGPGLTLDLALAPRTHDGVIAVAAPRGAQVLVDGKVVGAGAWTGRVAAGRHTIAVRSARHEPWSTDLVLREDETRDVPVTLAPAAPGLPIWAWVTGGAIVLGGLVAGGVLLATQTSSRPYDGPTGSLGTVPQGIPFRLF